MGHGIAPSSSIHNVNTNNCGRKELCIISHGNDFTVLGLGRVTSEQSLDVLPDLFLLDFGSNTRNKVEIYDIFGQFPTLGILLLVPISY